MAADKINNSGSREQGLIIYPVYSRRSCGLSIGINLFPDKKNCNFNCPYCEVFAFENKSCFTLEQMEKDLNNAIQYYKEANIEIKDICFSGNGEPTLSLNFIKALEKAMHIRDKLIPDTPLVLITNGTGLLSEKIFNVLAGNAHKGLDIWLKIDAGTEQWFNKINFMEGKQAGINFSTLIQSIKKFAALSPFIIQTMICKINGFYPLPEEERVWIDLVKELALYKTIKAVQIYGKARLSPHDPMAEAADISLLKKRKHELEKEILALHAIPVDIFE